MIKKTTLILLIYLLSCTNFFITGSYVFGVYYLDWISLELLVLCAILVLNRVPKSLGDDTRNFECCILWFVVLNIAQIFYTYLKYHQSITVGIKMMYFCFLLIIFFPLNRAFNTQKKAEELKKYLVEFVALCNIGTLLKYFLTGVKSCPQFYLLLISIPISISYVLYRQKSGIGWILLVSSILVRVFLSTNTAFLIIFIAVVIMQIYMYFYDRYLLTRNRVIANFLLFVLIGCLGVFGVIQSYIYTIINLDVGTRMRVLAIEYYIDVLKNAPLFGLGIIDPLVSTDFYKLVHGGLNRYGGSGQFYLEDIGIIGTVCQYGLISLIPLYYMVKGMIHSISKCEGINRLQNIGFFTMTICMFISLSPFNKAPIQILPLLFLMLSNNMRYQI